MRKLLYIFIVCFSNCLYCLSALGMVVHDPKSYIQAINQIRQTASHWKAQVNQFKEQNGMMKEQLASLTGTRDVGDVDGELILLRQELQGIEKHRDFLNNLLRSPNSEQNAQADEILNKYQLFRSCKEKGSRKLDNICKEEILNKAGTIEAGEDIRKQMGVKARETENLARKAKSTKDAKESQDLSNAIALKDMEMNQLKNQWDSFVDESNLREKLIEEKRREAFWEHQENAPLPNITFR